MRFGLLWAVLAAASLSCRLPQAVAPTVTPDPTSTPLPTPTPTPTPTPAPATYLESARTALRNGDWERALLEYQESAIDPDLRQEALAGQGQALLAMERFAEADTTLSILLDEPADATPVRARAHLNRARARLAIGDPGGAIDDYHAYLADRPGVLDSFVREWLGDALRIAGRPLEAIPEYEAAVGAGRASDTTPIRVKIGVAYAEAGQLEQALRAYDAVYLSSADPAIRATMNRLAGETLTLMGDVAGARARYLDSFENYPTEFDTYVGLVELVQAGVPVNEFQRGLVDYHAQAYEPALAAFERSLAQSPSAIALYYRGLTYLALGNSGAAFSDLEALTSSYPGDPIWADAMEDKGRVEWAYLSRYSDAVGTYLELARAASSPAAGAEATLTAGRIAERSSDLARAADIWASIAERYPGTGQAHEGAFLAGITRFRLSEYSSALDLFQRAEALAQDSGKRAGAALWIGKAHERLGESELARATWERARDADPTGYYSERADDLLEGVVPFERSGGFDFDTDVESERAEAEAWMRETFGIADSGPLWQLGTSLTVDPRLVRGEELWLLGRWAEARSELFALRLALSSDALSTYQLMHRLLELGAYREAIFSARQVLDIAGMDNAGTMSAPVYFNRVRFGPYYGDLILPAAAAAGLDGLFVLSVVRQESLFEGFATSYAAARGLMQVIPPTGESIASQLGWPPDYTSDDLYRPNVSVRFGTFYLEAQTDRFDGDLYAALSAYNAGPGNALIWKEMAPDDPDLYLEIIRLDQPQVYIRVIAEVYDIYRSLYASN